MELSRICEVCGQSTVRTICDECREFYCQNCSDYHRRFNATRDHHLIDLHPKYGDPQKEASESADKAELSSDFVKQLTVTENTVLYRAQVAVGREENTTVQREQLTVNENIVLYRAQVAVDREVKKDADAKHGATQNRDDNCTKKASLKENDSRTGAIAKSRDNTEKGCETSDSRLLGKENKIEQFSIKAPGDKNIATVQGILVLYQNLVVVDESNIKLKLFDVNGVYLSSVDSLHRVQGITSVTDNCFATCGMNRNVVLWTLRGAIVIEYMYDVDFSHGIHYNGTYFCVLYTWYNAITVLDTQGRQVRKIVRTEAFGKEVKFGLDIHTDKTTHNIYVVCMGDNNGVLCLSVHGDALWFTPLDGLLGGITEIDGLLCVSDYHEGHCVHMVSKSG